MFGLTRKKRILHLQCNQSLGIGLEQDNLAGFLGIQVEQMTARTMKLMHFGLIEHIIDALGLNFGTAKE